MSEEKKGMNKSLIIFAGIVVLLAVFLLGLKFGSGGDVDAGQTGVSDTGVGGAGIDVEIKTETKKPPLTAELTPAETVVAFYDAVWEERYDDAMQYVSIESPGVKSKWDLKDMHGGMLSETKGRGYDTIIREVEYLDQSKTMAIVDQEVYIKGTKENLGAGEVELQKESGIWKIIVY